MLPSLPTKARSPARRYRMTTKQCFAEFLGTFGLVFAGTGAIVINDASGGAVTHPGIALTFGLIVMTMIYAFGDISGAHINPAVTLAFAAAKRFPAKLVGPYIGSQLLGGLVASAFLWAMFPAHPTLGATLPAGSAMQSFLFELLLTFFLMLVILLATVGPREKTNLAGIVIGGVVGLEAMFAGPICGASMNPARSIAPAVMSGTLEHLWLYVVATTAGAVLAVPVAWYLQLEGAEETGSTSGDEF